MKRAGFFLYTRHILLFLIGFAAMIGHDAGHLRPMIVGSYLYRKLPVAACLVVFALLLAGQPLIGLAFALSPPVAFVLTLRIVKLV
jgi:hypothetical protein